MPTISILKNRELVDPVTFHKQLMVTQLGEKICWGADAGLAVPAAGEIHLWIRRQLGDAYSIAFIRPDWTLSVDHKTYPSALYQDISTNDRLIEAGYHEYVFVCQ